MAADQRWRFKLHAGLAIGAGLLLAAIVILAAIVDLPNQHGDDYMDEVAGIFVFLAIAAGLITFGIQRLLYARHLTRIEFRAPTSTGSSSAARFGRRIRPAVVVHWWFCRSAPATTALTTTSGGRTNCRCLATVRGQTQCPQLSASRDLALCGFVVTISAA